MTTLGEERSVFGTVQKDAFRPLRTHRREKPSPLCSLESHYAMPMLWGEQILGWANLKVVDRQLQHELGFAGPQPCGSAFQLALHKALQQMQEFLEL
jgi:hypothetical protein